MSTQSRAISMTAHVALSDAARQASSVYLELALIEKGEGGWLLVVTEPDSTQSEGDVLAATTVEVPDEAGGVFDDLFTQIADPARLGTRTR